LLDRRSSISLLDVTSESAKESAFHWIEVRIIQPLLDQLLEVVHSPLHKKVGGEVPPGGDPERFYHHHLYR
jgi:hypothetical protein